MYIFSEYYIIMKSFFEQSHKVVNLNAYNIQAYVYDLPLIQQQQHECWLCAVSIARSKDQNELKDNLNEIENKMIYKFGEEKLKDFKKNGINLQLEEEYRQFFGMDEISTDFLKNKDISSQEKYNQLKKLLEIKGPLLFKMQSMFNDGICHEHVLSGVMMGPKPAPKNSDADDIFFIINASFSIAHLQSVGCAKLDALPLKAFVLFDPNFKIYTPSKQYKKIDLYDDEKIINLISNDAFGDLMEKPSSIIEQNNNLQSNKCIIL